ncbi:MAG: hypothetical protein BMS9Abin37_1846 [Acidobacteriota bacterium]|nr:MAG: hypothetical protein BMS9Abin37_1846 [Acidobacteriota bacterium]
MSHLEEETLILHHYGESDDPESVELHLRDCEPCREELHAIGRDLQDVGSIPAPERGADYGAEVWRRVAPRLVGRGRWTAWLLAAAAILLAGTFLAGRLSMRWGVDVPQVEVRERILLVALGEHLDRSEVLLLEVVNTEHGGIGQEAARELLRESRLYRQTAYRVGDVATSDVLDELERLLLDVAHGTTPNDALRSRIEEQDVLFKIRILQTSVRAREGKLAPAKF